MANILVVDDAKFMRHMLKGILEDAGHTVVAQAEDGVQALEMYKQYNPDLVTMDITMPNKDGISAVKDIRAHDSKATIIMCSAMGQQNMVVEAIQAGAKDFLVKPFEANKIIATVTKHIG